MTRTGKKVKFLKFFILLLIPLFLLGAMGNGKASFPQGITGGFGTLSRDGKLSLELTVLKADLGEELRPRDAFERYVRSVLNAVNNSSRDDDMVTLKSVSESGEEYLVSVATRRVNANMKGMGDFAYDRMSRFTAPDSDTFTRLALMANGNLRCMLSKPFGELLGSVEIEAGTSKNQVYVRPLDALTGEEMSMEELSARGSAASENTRFSMFRLPDVGAVSRIRIRFPGKVLYRSSTCVEPVDERTVDLVPVTLVANVVRQEYVLDDEGNKIYDEAGVAATRQVNERDCELSCIFGYVAFDQGANWALIGCCIGGAALLLAAALFFGYRYREKLFGVPSLPVPAMGTQPAAGTLSAETAAGTAEALPFAEEKEKKEKKERRSLVVPGSVLARIKKHKLLYLMLLPAVALAITFCYVPMFGIIIAFKDYNLLEGFGGSEWVGFKYFIQIFTGEDPAVFLVFRNTIYIALIRVATNFPAILLFALLINEIKSEKLKSLTRTISYLPYFISWIAVGGMMISLFSVDDGVLNKVLTAVSGHEVRINWYAESKYWWMILALSSMWKSLGWGTIIYMSALGSINSELYDACRIDGGGRLRMVTTVTIPGIMNVIMLQLIMDAGNLVRDNYEQILAMTQGSSAINDTTYVVGAMSYSAIIGGSGFSQATAFGLVQGLLGLVLVLLTNQIAKKTDNEGVL